MYGFLGFEGILHNPLGFLGGAGPVTNLILHILESKLGEREKERVGKRVDTSVPAWRYAVRYRTSKKTQKLKK